MYKTIFGYIKNSLNFMINNNKNIFFVYGDDRIGKTFLAEEYSSYFPNTDYYKLYLNCNPGYQKNYSAFLWGISRADSLYETYKEISNKIINNSDINSLKIVKGLMSYHSDYVRKFSFLNEIEISIINSLNFYCKNKKLIMIADNIQYWDKQSQRFLYFLLSNEASTIIPFLKEYKIIIISNDKNKINDFNNYKNKITSVYIQGYKSSDKYLQEYVNLKFGNNELAETLFQITNGNMGLTKDIHLYLEKNINISDVLDAQKIFFTIIEKHLKKISVNYENLTFILKAASVQGKDFNDVFLPLMLPNDEFSIERVLDLALKENVIKSYKIKNATYSFLNVYIYEYFNQNYNTYRKEFHYKYACAVKQINPRDHYTLYLHFRASGHDYEAIEHLVIYLVRQRYNKVFVDSELLDYLKENTDLYENYLIISKSIDLYNQGNFYDAINKLELIEPISNIILVEKDYFYALFIYDGCVNQKTNEAYNILNNIFNETLKSNFDIWLKSSLLLYIYYVNRLCDLESAKTVEKIIMKEIANRYYVDASLNIIINILNRNASALYSTEIALQKCKKSVDFFEKNENAFPLEMIYAFTNYSGILMNASMYEEGFYYAKKAILFIYYNNILIKDKIKVINNYLVNGVLCNKITTEDAVQICKKMLKNEKNNNSILLRNNYYIFKTINGDYNNLLTEMEELFYSDIIQMHNDYYIYLIGNNIMFVSLIIGKNSSAKKYTKS